MVAPTGAGKTHILAHQIRAFIQGNPDPGATAIYVVHRRELVRQTHTVLHRLGVPSAVLMAGEDIDWSKRVFVISRDTLWRRKAFAKLRRVSLVIFDEAHIGVKKQKEIVRMVNPKVVLGYTATPISLSGPGMGALYETLVQGPTYQELIKEDYLVPTRFIPYEPSLELLNLPLGPDGDYKLQEVIRLLRRGQVLEDPLKAYRKHIAPGEPTIWFAPSVEIAEETARRLRDGGITAETISWRTPEEERKRIIQAFKAGKIKVLTNVDVFSEGWDAPEVRAIVLANPTRSLARYLQRVGRGMRPAPGKTYVKIVDLVGSVFLHGLPEAIEGWDLEPARVDRLADGLYAVVKRKPLCPKCRSRLREWGCPSCGWRPMPQYAQSWYEILRGRLTNEIAILDERRKLFYAGLLYYCKKHGKSWRFASSLYKERFGISPPEEWRWTVTPREYSPASDWAHLQEQRLQSRMAEFQDTPAENASGDILRERLAEALEKAILASLEKGFTTQPPREPLVFDGELSSDTSPEIQMYRWSSYIRRIAKDTLERPSRAEVEERLIRAIQQGRLPPNPGGLTPQVTGGQAATVYVMQVLGYTVSPQAQEKYTRGRPGKS